MLDTCHNVSSSLELSFNCSKSHCICFGAQYKYRLEPMILGNESINWVSQITYLGMYISVEADRYRLILVQPSKRFFQLVVVYMPMLNLTIK
jgi:hypothetical protein